MLTSLFSLFYVTGEFHRFHRGRAVFLYDPMMVSLSKLTIIFRAFTINVFLLSLTIVYRRDWL